jgi:23S rRNA pseudouridine1911/1915/1917 synthase
MNPMPTPLRWVVREGDGATVGQVVMRTVGDREAIPEGRVFLGRVRVTDPSRPVAVGDVVTIGPPSEAAESVRILADEGGVVAADKPCGMPTIPDQRGASHCLLAVLAKTLGCAVRTLHPTSRLDRDVSGVVLFARTEEAGARLKRARAAGEYFRRYVAIAARVPLEPRGEWSAPIGRARDPKKRAVYGRDALDATTCYETIAVAKGYALLALEPASGRTHQLRVHAAHAGSPLLGDRAYGGATRLVLDSGEVWALQRVALHAARVVVPGASNRSLDVRSPVPAELRQWWAVLGGKEDDWEAAVTRPLC